MATVTDEELMVWWRHPCCELVPFDDALQALGGSADLGRRRDDVALDAIVGSQARSDDFDGDFRLRSPHLQPRWDHVAALMRRGGGTPPIDLLQLGQMYFVVDGHHRVSVARHLGHATIDARVQRLCTIAFGMACLRRQHLAHKTAERRFLERVPLPDPVREDLWLDEPSTWPRLADHAEAWGLVESRRQGRLLDAHEVARRWWEHQVVPMVDGVRSLGQGVSLRDIEVYALALRVHDERPSDPWPLDAALVADHVACTTAS